ncbi:hypothetical protein BDF14DRAFT_1867758 [Spinellus fusiger]|nr:hypothetical protein BDF14DRAFT_1867758 [Spinellus fusiger]
MANLILGPHNGIRINGTHPRRPKTRRKLLKDSEEKTETTECVPLTVHQKQLQTVQRLNSFPSQLWCVESTQNGQYRITMDNMSDMMTFINALGQMEQNSSLHTHRSGENPTVNSITNVYKYHAATLPYMNFHSELYANAVWKPTVEWPKFSSMLLTLIDDCFHYYMECMNHYYPVMPKKTLLQWYASLEDPSKDPLALSISTFWVRHVLIHHPPATLRHLHDGKILDAIQCKLASLTRDALADCFDVPHPQHILALCILNMTAVIPIAQKALYHTMAVRMALSLDIKPLRHQHTASDREELENRLWWYLFQIDHFLHESRAISSSMLQPSSDNHNALLQLQRPGPCSLDEPEESTGAVVWGNILKIWIMRCRLLKKIVDLDLRDEQGMNLLFNEVTSVIEQWTVELPDYLRPEAVLNTVHGPFAEQCYSINMERCTNLALLLHGFLPRESLTLTVLQKRAVLLMIDNSSELISMRLSVLVFAPCQTWPGDLKRSVELLSQSLRYNDSAIVTRAKLGLIRALRMLRSMAEVRWEDEICIEMITKIELVLLPGHGALETSSSSSMSMDTSEVPESPSRSIKIANNLYEGVMMFDRDLRPRARYYNPIQTQGMGNITFIEEPAHNYS